MGEFESTPQFNPDQQIPKEKSQERLQAQAEVFADKGVKKFSGDQAKLLRYSAELSKIRDLNNLPPDLPEELVELIRKHKDTYVNFLRLERKLETSFIEENIKTYREKFQPVIEELKAKIGRGNFKELPEYLGSGRNGSAFRIEVDGKTYAVKFSQNITQANFELKPLLRGKDIPHVAQLISYSFEDGVVVMELLPGTDITNFTPGEAPEYPDEHIVQLIDTVRELDANGLTIDPKPSNFMYDRKLGFSILDYHLKKNGGRYGFPQQVIDLRGALTARKFEQHDYKDPDYREKAETQAIEEYKIYLPMMIRFLGILKEKYPDVLTEWQRQHEEDKKNPNMSVSELIDRRYIPKHLDLQPHLKKLEEMGF